MCVVFFFIVVVAVYYFVLLVSQISELIADNFLFTFLELIYLCYLFVPSHISRVGTFCVHFWPYA